LESSPVYGREATPGPRFEITPAIKRRLFAHVSWLNAKIAVGHAASFGLIAVVCMSAGNHLLHNAGIVLAVLWTFGVVRQLKERITKIRACRQELLERSSEEWEQVRIKAAVERVQPHSGVPEPLIRLNPQSTAGLWDRLLGRDVLTFDPEYAAKLSARGLDGVVAHELAHSNRWDTKLNSLKVYAAIVGAVTLHWGIANVVRWQLGWTGIFGTPSAWAVGVTAGLGARIVYGIVVSQIHNFISRANELKNDLRAVKLTRDPDGYLSALAKGYEHLEPRPHDQWRRRMSSHPTFERRAQEVQRVFREIE